MKKILTIAGSDCSGGAGIQADIKTITAHKMYAMSVITALTAQNTTGVYSILETDPEFVGKQMDEIFNDIIPDAVKIGMLSNKSSIEIISNKLLEYNVKNIVLDPVMVSSSGRKLLKDDAMDILIHRLIPLVSVITPNIPEAEVLCGFTIESKEDMQRAALKLAETFKGSILVKGGHLKDSSDDLLYTNYKFYWFEQTRIENPNTHGTGCTLSSAIACNIASGKSINASVQTAKEYLTGALKANLNIGKGNGPLNHSWNIK